MSRTESRSHPIRIAIVEDDAGLLETLQQVFGAAPDFRIVAACQNAEDALEQFPTAAPEVVLMDINLPGMSGIECLRRLKEVLPKVRVIMLTVYDDNHSLFQSLVGGADGYLLKRSTRRRMVEMVREIVGGGAPISPQVARRMVEYFHHLQGSETQGLPASAMASPEMESLTAREQEVLAKLAEGLVPKEVASELGITWETVRNHITNIYGKLHVRSRTEAVLKYLGRQPGSHDH
jgi:DNA-binding NarL/FixJ family response regulator